MRNMRAGYLPCLFQGMLLVSLKGISLYLIRHFSSIMMRVEIEMNERWDIIAVANVTEELFIVDCL